jgi:nucleotide-binding universal stress UspA family protein
MGTHGRKGMDKIIFGSVAERVVKIAPVPVMVVNPYKTDDLNN